MYQILARKWRPKNFGEVVGQQHVVRALTNSLQGDRLHHAYLFTGTRGVGKTTLARIFARCLNCETNGVTAEPCGTCGVCEQITAGNYADLIEVDAASRTGVDDMRELLESAQYKPMHGRRKIYLIDEVHMLSINSFNALLKTLEEPPEYVMFLFATTHPKKIPITVLSRCLQLNLTRLPHAEIADHMKKLLDAEEVPYEEGAVREIASAADGSVRDGLSILDQAVAHGAGELKLDALRDMLGIVGRDEIGKLLQAVVARDAEGLLAITDELYAKSADFVGMASDMVSFLHAVSIAQAAAQSEVDTQFDAETVRALAKEMSPEDTQLFYQIAVNGMRDMPVLSNVRSGFEMMCLRMLSFQPLTAASIDSSSGGGGVAGASGGAAGASGGARSAGSDAASASGNTNGAKSAAGGASDAGVAHGARSGESDAEPSSAVDAATKSAPNTSEADNAPPSSTQAAGTTPNTARNGRAIDSAGASDAGVAHGARSGESDAEPSSAADAATKRTANTSEADNAPAALDNASAEADGNEQAGEMVTPTSPSPPASADSGNGDLGAYQEPAQWSHFIRRLPKGLVTEICSHSVLCADSNDSATLFLDAEYDFLTDLVSDDELSEVFSAQLGRTIKVSVQKSPENAETPRRKEQRLSAEKHQQAIQATQNDPVVRELQKQFGARVIPNSVQAMNGATADASNNKRGEE